MAEIQLDHNLPPQFKNNFSRGNDRFIIVVVFMIWNLPGKHRMRKELVVLQIGSMCKVPYTGHSCLIEGSLGISSSNEKVCSHCSQLLEWKETGNIHYFVFLSLAISNISELFSHCNLVAISSNQLYFTTQITLL